MQIRVCLAAPGPALPVSSRMPVPCRGPLLLCLLCLLCQSAEKGALPVPYFSGGQPLLCHRGWRVR